MRIPFISLIAGGALALGGCAYGDLGLGLGTGYGGYGYGSPYYGASYGYGYGSPYYGGYGYGSPYYGGLGSSYYGWNNGYYYPGSGYYVYDSYRRPYAMTTTQRQYWSTRSPALRTSSSTATTRTAVKPNWSAFSQRRVDRQTARATARAQRQTAAEQRRTSRRNND
jgi:hypothetical protein